MTTVWRNWAGNEQARPVQVVSPADADEVVTAVKDAARDGLGVKPVGSGHSFSPVAVAPGVLLRLDRMDRLVDADPATGQVRVEAGIPLSKLNALLAEHRLAMENLGDIDRQTVAGATATGTHGSGGRFGSISTQIRALELVLADGSLVRCSATERPELFAAARVGIGALGVVTRMTLQCVPSYALHAVDAPSPLARTLEEIDERVDGNDHFEFFWFPHTETALTRRYRRLPADTPLRPVSRLRRVLDDQLIAGVGFEYLNRLGTAVPRLVPPLTRLVTRALSAREYTDVSHRVLASQRNVRFREGEYAIPREHVADVLREIRQWVRSHGENVSFPLEVRFVAGDDIWLSPSYQRESAYVAFHQYHRMPYRRYFQGVESILGAVGGRPHWGKMHRLDAAALRPRYPRFDDFVGLRDILDPGGVFANPYLDRVLGKLPARAPSR